MYDNTMTLKTWLTMTGAEQAQWRADNPWIEEYFFRADEQHKEEYRNRQLASASDDDGFGDLPF